MNIVLDSYEREPFVLNQPVEGEEYCGDSSYLIRDSTATHDITDDIYVVDSLVCTTNHFIAKYLYSMRQTKDYFSLDFANNGVDQLIDVADHWFYYDTGYWYKEQLEYRQSVVDNILYLADDGEWEAAWREVYRNPWIDDEIKEEDYKFLMDPLIDLYYDLDDAIYFDTSDEEYYS